MAPTRKLFALMLVLLLCFTLAACAEKQEAIPTTSTAPQPIKLGVPMIGAIYPGTYDAANSYSQTQYNLIALAMRGASMDPKTQLVAAENVASDLDSVRNAVKQLVDQGANVIFSTEFNYSPHMLEIAEEYPHVAFCQLGGTDRNGQNLVDCFFEIYKSYYVLGCYAGVESLAVETEAIGFVSAYGLENPDAVSAINAFTLGVLLQNPNATVYLKVLSEPHNRQLEEAAAKALVAQQGCGVLACYTNTDATLTTAEYLGIPACGPYIDAESLAPNSTLLSARFDRTMYLNVILAAQNSSYAYELGDRLGADRYYAPYNMVTNLSKTDTKLTGNDYQLYSHLENFLENNAPTDPNHALYNEDFFLRNEGIFSGARPAELRFLEGGGIFSREDPLDLVDTEGNVIVGAGQISLTTDEIRSMDFYVKGIVLVEDAQQTPAG